MEEDRKKVKLECTKRVLIFSAGCGSVGMLFIRSLNLRKSLVSAHYSDNAVLIFSFIFSDPDLNI